MIGVIFCERETLCRKTSMLFSFILLFSFISFVSINFLSGFTIDDMVKNNVIILLSY